MTRSEYLILRNDLNLFGIEIIKNYASEKGMDMKVFEAGIAHPLIRLELPAIIEEVIKYYDREFEINLLINKNNQIIKIY